MGATDRFGIRAARDISLIVGTATRGQRDGAERRYSDRSSAHRAIIATGESDCEFSLLQAVSNRRFAWRAAPLNRRSLFVRRGSADLAGHSYWDDAEGDGKRASLFMAGVPLPLRGSLASSVLATVRPLASPEVKRLGLVRRTEVLRNG
jgi:hypothetical protein